MGARSTLQTTAACGLAGALALLLAGLPLQAQDGAAPPATRDGAGQANPVVVLLVDRRGEPDPQPVIQAVRAQVSDLPVDLEIHWASPPAGDLPRQAWMAQQIARASMASLVLWLAPLEGDRLFLMVPETDHPLLERNLGEPAGEASAEVTAIIARNAIRSWLAGVPIEADPLTVEPAPPEAEEPPPPPTPSEAEEPPPPPPAAEDQPWGGRLSLDVGYSYLGLHDDHPAVHGARFALNVWIARGLRGLVGYYALESVSGSTAGFTLDVGRHPITLGLRWSHPVGPLELGGGVDVLLDIVKEQLTRTPQGAAPTGNRREIDFSVHPSVRLDWPLVPWLRAYIAAGVEIAASRTEYHVEIDSEKRTIIESWPVRPLIVVGMAAGFL